MAALSTTFKETGAAAGLLEEFYSLSRKRSKRFTRSTNAAATAFFNKDFLTIADFVAPIGEVLTVPAPERPERETSVSSFISSNVHRTKKISRSGRVLAQKKETIGDFMIRLND